MASTDVTALLKQTPPSATDEPIPAHISSCASGLSERMRCPVVIKSITSDGATRQLNIEVHSVPLNPIIDALRKDGAVLLRRQGKDLVVDTGHQHILTHFCSRSRGVLNGLSRDFPQILIKLVDTSPPSVPADDKKMVTRVAKRNHRHS